MPGRAVMRAARPRVTLLRAQSLGLQNRAEESQLLLDALDPGRLEDHELAYATALKISNLWSPLQRPEDAATLVDEAMAGPNPVVSNAGRVLRVLHLAAQARPAQALAVAAQVDEADLGDFVALELAWGKTIAAGDLGLVSEITSAAQDRVRHRRGTRSRRPTWAMDWPSSTSRPCYWPA